MQNPSLQQGTPASLLPSALETYQMTLPLSMTMTFRRPSQAAQARPARFAQDPAVSANPKEWQASLHVYILH
jgi:hypothetical protein